MYGRRARSRCGKERSLIGARLDCEKEKEEEPGRNEQNNRGKNYKAKVNQSRKHCSPSFWHATLASENLIILITIPLWETHQLSRFRGGTPFKNVEDWEHLPTKGKSLGSPLPGKV